MTLQGSLFQRRTGRCAGRWVLTIAGKQKLAPSTILTQDQAEQWAQELGAQAAQPPAVVPPALKELSAGMTVAQVGAKWIPLRREMERAETTVDGNQGHLDTWIVPLLGTLPAGNLPIPKLREFIRMVSSERDVNTTRNIASTLATMLDDAMGEGWIPPAVNPMREKFVRSIIPKAVKTRLRKHLSMVKAAMLINSEQIPLHRRIRYAIGFLTGLRDGEISGLRWCDIHLDEGRLEVRKAFSMYRTLGKTKTVSSVRDVPIHPELLAILTWWRAEGWQAWVCRERRESDFVVPRETGEASRPRSADNLRDDLERLGLEAQIDGEDIEFRHVRTSFATTLRKAGIDIPTIGRLLGHSGRSVTEAHYTDDDFEQLRAAVSVINVVINPVILITLPPELAENAAPAARIELAANGLGNRCSIP